MDGIGIGMSPFVGRTGRGVRVAVIDSGVHVAHPHIIAGVAGGVTVCETIEPKTYADQLGHGTAVMAAIQEKAPEAEYYAVRVFCSSLRTRIEYLLRAIEWSIEQRVHVVNLSLGTSNPEHAERFRPLIARAAETGVVLVSARDANGESALPGSLPGVIAVGLDWECPRDSYRYVDGALYASGYPRPIPGVPQERNLNGASFAVANMTGFVVRACEGLKDRSYQAIIHQLSSTSDTACLGSAKVTST